MNLNLLSRALKQYWRSALTFGVGLFLYSLMVVAIAPTIIENPAMKKLVEQYPKEVMALVTSGTGANLFPIEGYLSLEYLGLWWIFIIGSFAITFSSAIASKEIDDGTIESLLNQPLSRSSLILSKFGALFIYLVGLIVLSLGGIALLGPSYDVKVKTAGLVGVDFVGLVFLIAISAYTLLFSVILRGRGKAVVFSVVLLVGAQLLNGFGQLNETVEKFRFLSFFNYYDPSQILKTGDIPWSDVGVFVAIAVICVLLSLYIFKRKDIAPT